MGVGQTSGFVKLHRKVTASWLWRLPPAHWKVACACLLAANWQEDSWYGRPLAPGQFITSQANLAAFAGVTVKQVRSSLRTLRARNFLEVVAGRASSYTTIRVVNFEAYQCTDDEEGEQRANEGRVKGEQRATGEAGKQGRRTEDHVGLCSDCSEASTPSQPELFGSNNALADVTLSAAPPPVPSPSPSPTRPARQAPATVAAVTARVIEFLNREAKRTLTAKPYEKRVRALLEAGHTEREMRLVVGWACETWLRDEKMREYITPRTLFPLQKSNGGRAFPEYLDLAREKYRQHTGREFERHAPSTPSNGASHAPRTERP